MTDAESHVREGYPPRGQLLGHAGISVGNPLCGAATMTPRHLTGGSPYPARRTCGVRGRVLTGLGQPYGTRALPGPPRTGRAAVRCATRADVVDQADGATAAGGSADRRRLAPCGLLRVSKRTAATRGNPPGAPDGDS